MKRIDLLKGLIKDASNALSSKDVCVDDLVKYGNIFMAKMHVGCNKHGEMEQDTEGSKVLKLEWFAGILVDLANNKQLKLTAWLSMANWICD